MKKTTSILLAISLVFMQTFAQILPSDTDTKIQKADKKSTVIDIAAPNDRGVSFNEYLKFDTSSDVTILNNSPKNIRSSTGEYIKANSNLKSNSAKLIINQINDKNPANLKGILEIVGDKAGLIIANPNGLMINDLTVTNASSATFITAKFNKKDNNFEFINPNSKIDIVGNGIKGENTYINIISNAIDINAHIQADELNLINPSLDSASIGGMYRDKIRLIGTGSGLGVNNKGAINANKIRINSNGDIVNDGVIRAKEIRLKADTIENNAYMISDSFDSISNSFLNKHVISTDRLDITSKSIINHRTISANRAKIVFERISGNGNIYANDLKAYTTAKGNQASLIEFQKRDDSLQTNLKNAKDSELLKGIAISKKTTNKKVTRSFRRSRSVAYDSCCDCIDCVMDDDKTGICQANLGPVTVYANVSYYTPSYSPYIFDSFDGHNILDPFNPLIGAMIGLPIVYANSQNSDNKQDIKPKENPKPEQKQEVKNKTLEDIKDALNDKKGKDKIKLKDKEYKLDKENTKDALVIEDKLSDKEIIDIFRDLTQNNKMQHRRTEIGDDPEVDIYTVKTKHGNFNLRNGSSSSFKDGSKPRWTIEVPGKALGKEKGRYEIKFR